MTEEQFNRCDGAQAPREQADTGSVLATEAGCGSADPAGADGAAATTPPEAAVDSDGHNAGSNNGSAEAKPPISQKRLAANRKNAQRSKGPKTVAGKASSSKNSYKHGLCAQHLFRPGEQRARDIEAYQELSARVRGYYRPQGFIEEFLIEKIVTEMVRFSRIVGHEQSELDASFLSITTRSTRFFDMRLRAIVS